MQALILAGGMGTRLRPVVSDVPKSMASVAGRPFLEYLLAQLRRDGFGDVVVCSGYLGDLLESHFGRGERFGLAITYSVEEEPRGTAGALKLAEPVLAGDEWLVMNGDSLFDISLASLAHAHASGAAIATIALAQVPDARRYGTVTRSRGGEITAFVEKSHRPRTGLINSGLYMIDRRVLDLIPADRPASLERDVLPQLVDGRLHGHLFDGYFIDIGVPGDYVRAQADHQVFERLLAGG